MSPLLQFLLPEMVDGLQQTLAIAHAAERECEKASDGPDLRLLFEEEANLVKITAYLRALRLACSERRCGAHGQRRRTVRRLGKASRHRSDADV